MLAHAFATTASEDRPTDGNIAGVAAQKDDSKQKPVSDFITVQSFTNLSAMTGAITAAWAAMRLVWPLSDGRWFPFALCLVFGGLSVAFSKPTGLGNIASASFIAFLNSLVLFGAVVSATELTTASTTP